MIKGTTKSGFNFNIDDNALDDFELVEALAEVEDNPLAISKVVTHLFGKGKKELYQFIKDKKGYVSTAEISAIISEVFESVGKSGKNL